MTRGLLDWIEVGKREDDMVRAAEDPLGKSSVEIRSEARIRRIVAVAASDHREPDAHSSSSSPVDHTLRRAADVYASNHGSPFRHDRSSLLKSLY